jgi:hypothetical protein
LKAFAWDRFLAAAGSAKLAANARYAASMHQSLKRATCGWELSAAVGTELGSYSSARSGCGGTQTGEGF